jgi:predicted RNase H-like HicB family nuclease
MIYDIYLQVKRTGRTHAHVPGLPGCNWLDDSPEAAWQRAADQIARHLSWLRKYGQPAPPVDEPVLPHLAQHTCRRPGKVT